MSFGILAYCDGYEIINSGDNPCRSLGSVGTFSSAGTHIVTVNRSGGGDVIWTPFYLASDPDPFLESSPKMVITNVVAYGSTQLKVTTESGYHNMSSYLMRALVYEWS